MSRRTLRVSLGILAAAAVLTLATPARAAFYIPGFDPEFDGSVLFRIGDACLLLSDGTYSVATHPECQVDMVSAAVFDTNAPSVVYTGSQLNVAFDVVIAGNELTELLTQLFTELGPLGDPIVCAGDSCADLEFFTGCGFTEDPCEPLATLAFDSTFLRDGYRLIRQPDGAPEPGTLGLIFGAVGAAWLARRRKAAA
ncbi:MAG TPA: PEP-CTERM sorting domain-containing protein [Pseudolabrys sp.]